MLSFGIHDKMILSYRSYPVYQAVHIHQTLNYNYCNCAYQPDLSLPTSNMLTFDVTIEEVMQMKCLTVTPVKDDIFEDTETFTLSLTSTTAGALLGEPSNTAVSITDDDGTIVYLYLLIVYIVHM